MFVDNSNDCKYSYNNQLQQVLQDNQTNIFAKLHANESSNKISNYKANEGQNLTIVIPIEEVSELSFIN